MWSIRAWHGGIARRSSSRTKSGFITADEIRVYHCVQRVVRRAFLCGDDSLSGKSYDHRRTWIRDRLESLAGLFGVEIAVFVCGRWPTAPGWPPSQ